MFASNQSDINSGLRSVHLTNYYHERSGGVKTNYDRLLAAANRHERYVSLIVPGEEDRLENVGRFGKIYYVRSPRAPFFDRRYRLMTPLLFLGRGTPIRKILLAERPDIVEIYDNYALTFLAGMTRIGRFEKLGRPMLVYFTGERFDTIFKTFAVGGRSGSWISRQIMKNYNIPMFDFYIANSEYVADEIREAAAVGKGLISDRFSRFCGRFFESLESPIEHRLAVCPRGVDTELFNPGRRNDSAREAICDKAGVPSDCTLVLSSTRLSREKNVKILPEIIELLSRDSDKDYRLLIAGDGPLKDWIREASHRRAPGKTIFLGHLTKNELADAYSNADVFVHPNPREPFGNVCLEAMASGVITVLPRSGGVRSYAHEDNSWLSGSEPHEFAKTIHQAMSQAEITAQKVSNALYTARNNSVESATDRLLKTYDAMYESFESKKVVPKRILQMTGGQFFTGNKPPAEG